MFYQLPSITKYNTKHFNLSLYRYNTRMLNYFNCKNNYYIKINIFFNIKHSILIDCMIKIFVETKNEYDRYVR